MTATLPAPTAAAERCALFTGITGALMTDCERFDLAPSDVNVHSQMGYTSAAVAFPGGETASVDALAGAYGLPAANPDGGLYGRTGRVTVDGHEITVLLYCARPAVPA